MHLTNISLVECSKLQKSASLLLYFYHFFLFNITFIFFPDNGTVCKPSFHFFNASASLPSGATNLWSQTGSMRVRGQTLIVCFLFNFFYSSTYLPLPPSHPAPPPPCWKMLNILPFITYSSTLDTSSPPCSSVPPLLLPHLLLSVNPPVPVSHVLMPSSPCDPSPVCEVAPAVAPFMMLARASVTLRVCCHYCTVCSFLMLVLYQLMCLLYVASVRLSTLWQTLLLSG